MRFTMSLAVLLLFASTAAAQEPPPNSSGETPAVVTGEALTATPAAAPASEAAEAKFGPRVPTPTFAPVNVTERAADDAAMAPLDPPSNFWWLVGAIVVAGIVLAVVL